jgi:hypothetical protein
LLHRNSESSAAPRTRAGTANTIADGDWGPGLGLRAGG